MGLAGGDTDHVDGVCDGAVGLGVPAELAQCRSPEVRGEGDVELGTDPSVLPATAGAAQKHAHHLSEGFRGPAVVFIRVAGVVPLDGNVVDLATAVRFLEGDGDLLGGVVAVDGGRRRRGRRLRAERICVRPSRGDRPALVE